MKYFVLLALLLPLTGCTGIEVAAEAVYDKKQEIDDARVKNAKRCLCDDCSVGAVKREFAGKAEEYNAVCSNSPVGIVK